MIPEPIRKQVGEEIHGVIMTAKLTGATKEANAWQLIRVLRPYLKTISTHTLSKMLVDTMLKMRAAERHYGRYRLHLRKDLNSQSPFPLSIDQVTNIGKLRLWGLVHHADKDNPRSGSWLLTPKGHAFLKGEITVPRTIYSFLGHRVDLPPGMPDSKPIHVKQYKLELPDFETYYDYVPPRPPAPADRTEPLPIFTK